VRATSAEAQLRDNPVLTLRIPNRRQPCPRNKHSRVMTALSGWSRRGVRSRTSPDAVAPGRPGRRLWRHKTQYKCGKSWIWNNHPLGKPGYDQRLLLAPASRLRWIELAVETSLSNGTHMLVHSAADGSTKAGHPRDGMALPEAFRTVGPEGMTRAGGNEVMRQAGATGAEAG
jgi:hypothetical protein